ncbi:GNAT family N-acetyltransferase [Psychrobacter sp. AOP1-A1-57]
MWQELIAHPDVIVWIAYDAHHHNLGFISYFINNKNYEITTLYVLPDYQGLGIGTHINDSIITSFLRISYPCPFLFMGIRK